MAAKDAKDCLFGDDALLYGILPTSFSV